MLERTKIIEQYDKQKKLYENFAEEVHRLLTRLLKQEAITCNAITWRVKERESLGKKIELKDKYTDLKDITDIAGIRVITYYVEDVDKIAKLVEQEFVVDIENSIDKRKALEPDKFGYCSVHYVVGMSESRLKLREYSEYEGLKCEIQIRSVLQHAWAEIEHDLGYKSEITVPKDIRRNFSRLAGLLEIADKEFQEIKQRIEVYKTEVENQIAEDNIDNTDIDAVTLKMVLDNNNDIKEINDKILMENTEVKFSDKTNPSEFETVIKSLNYFNIYKLSHLLELIEKRKEYSLELVSKIATVMKEKGDKERLFSCTAALLYVCYAELLMTTDQKENIEEFLKIKLGEDKDFRSKMATFLLAIKNNIK